MDAGRRQGPRDAAHRPARDAGGCAVCLAIDLGCGRAAGGRRHGPSRQAAGKPPPRRRALSRLPRALAQLSILSTRRRDSPAHG